MRIFQINSVCGIGSTGRIVTDLYKELISQGDQCCIAYGRGKAPINVDSYKIDNQFEVYYHAFMTRITDKHGLYSNFATQKLVRKIQQYDPDVIHLHNIHGYYINYKILFEFLKNYNKPVVWTLHDCWAFTGHCAHFDYIGCEKWKSGCFNCPQRKEYPKSLIIDNSRSNYFLKKHYFTSLSNILIVTPSIWLAKKVEESFFYRYPIRIVNNGINTDIFKPVVSEFKKNININNKKVILGVSNNWNNKKGFNDFVKLSRIIDEDTIILLIGLSKKQIKNLPKNIIGLLKTNDINKLAYIYSAADYFFNPTYEDTYPTVNLEALSCGIPVITYDTGGCAETVEGYNGVVVRQGDLEKVNQLIRFWGGNGKQYGIMKNVSISDRLSEYLKLYKEVKL